MKKVFKNILKFIIKICIAISLNTHVSCYINNGQSAISEGNYFYIGTGVDIKFRNF